MARLSAVALAIVLVGAGAGHPAAGALLVVGGFPVGRVEHESRVADEAPGDAGAARPLARAATPRSERPRAPRCSSVRTRAAAS